MARSAGRSSTWWGEPARWSSGSTGRRPARERRIRRRRPRRRRCQPPDPRTGTSGGGSASPPTCEAILSCSRPGTVSLRRQRLAPGLEPIDLVGSTGAVPEADAGGPPGGDGAARRRHGVPGHDAVVRGRFVVGQPQPHLGGGPHRAPGPRCARSPPPPRAPPQPPKAWILVDADRGVVLAADNPHEPLPVASAAKLMTTLPRRSPPRSRHRHPRRRHGRRPDAARRIGMKVGEIWPRQEALEAALIVSANDAAYALGTAAAGSLADFGAAAAAEGRSLGLRDSTWVDPAGLDGADGFGAGNHVSAFDLAILASRAVLADPLLSSIVDEQLVQFVGPDGTPHTLHQHNKLLDTYPGAIGVKTGFTTNAGEVLVAAARRDGRTLIAALRSVVRTPTDRPRSCSTPASPRTGPRPERVSASRWLRGPSPPRLPTARRRPRRRRSTLGAHPRCGWRSVSACWWPSARS